MLETKSGGGGCHRSDGPEWELSQCGRRESFNTNSKSSSRISHCVDPPAITGQSHRSCSQRSRRWSCCRQRGEKRSHNKAAFFQQGHLSAFYELQMVGIKREREQDRGRERARERPKVTWAEADGRGSRRSSEGGVRVDRKLSIAMARKIFSSQEGEKKPQLLCFFPPRCFSSIKSGIKYSWKCRHVG